MSFGRKGVVPGTADQMAARRAAVIAEERARAASAPERPAPALERRAQLGSATVQGDFHARDKTKGMAYLLWFLLGGFAAHRFYLGFTTSAIAQLILAPLGYAMVFGKEPMGFFLVIGGGLWILADAFMIPSMLRKANARNRQAALEPVFA